MISNAVVHSDEEEPKVARHLTDAVNTLFDRLRTWSMGRVNEVNEMTANESLAVGDSLNSIVNQSRSYVEHMRLTMGRFVANQNDELSLASDDGDESKSTSEDASGIGAIQEQGKMLGVYLRDLEVAFTSQNRVAKEALKQLSAVRRAGSHILDVSNQARMLAVNASIEAARLSSTHGGAFGVIASEMSSFAKNMQKQSDDIVQIVDGLTGSLPAIAEMAEQLRIDMDDFSRKFDQKSAEVESVVDELQSAITDALREGDDRIAKILKHSQEALSHLQFQDPCAQRLTQIEADIIRVNETAVEVLRTGNADLAEHVGSVHSHTDASAGHVILFDDDGVSADGDDENTALAAGELLLF